MSCLNRCYFVFLWFFPLHPSVKLRVCLKLHSFFSANSTHKPPLGVPQAKFCARPIGIKIKRWFMLQGYWNILSVQVYWLLEGSFDKSLGILYEKWSHFVKMLLLTDLILLFKCWRFNCKVHEFEIHVVGLSSNRHLPIFLEGVLWGLYKSPVFKIRYYEDFIIFTFVFPPLIFCNKVWISNIFIPSTLMQCKMILAVIKKKKQHYRFSISLWINWNEKKNKPIMKCLGKAVLFL